MKRLSIISLSMLLATSISATEFTKVQALSTTDHTASPTAVSSTIDLTNIVTCNYDGTNYGTVGDYYMILSTTANATYNANEGTTSATDGWVFNLDLFNELTNPIVLGAGTYTAITDPYPENPAALSAIIDYSGARYYDENGNVTRSATLSSDVTVTRNDDGVYTVTAEMKDDASGATLQFKYSGRLPFNDPSAEATVYRQLNEDRIDIKFTGGMAFYYGPFQSEKAGTMMIQLYDGEFDTETGGCNDGTQMICLDLIGRLFPDKSKIAIDPGTYVISPLFGVQRNQAGAAREIDYMGVTVVLGTYLRDYNTSKYGEDRMAYAYLKTGDIVVEKDGDNYHITLANGVTDRGFNVTFDYTGPIGPIVDSSVDGGGSALSTIEDDVDLKLDDLPVARCYDGGNVGGNQVFILDIGSRSGRDPQRDSGGDLMRLEIVNAHGTSVIEPGSYTLADNSYPDSYLPGAIIPTHWVTTSYGGSDISGTCYIHMQENRNYIMDHYAFLTLGKLGVNCDAAETDALDERTYTFEMDFESDNGFFVTGTWTGPVKLMYNPETLSSIGHVGTDGDNAKIYTVGEGRYQIANYIGEVTVYNVAGSLCGTYDSNEIIDLSGMPAGIYIAKIGKTSIKICK